MNLATWKSIKSPVMQEIRKALKKKAAPGEPTPSNKIANQTWREEILGILSEEQKKQKSVARQKSAKKVRVQQDDDE